MYTERDCEDIHPYNDDEINPALYRIVNVPEFSKVLEYIFPDRKKEDIIAELKGIHSAINFQKQFMHPLVNSIVKKTSKGLTYSGFDLLVPGTPYLFVSNHRDIVLDSAILQVLLFDNGHLSSEITFGSNLMSNPFVIDFGKINRMFTVYRGGNRKEMFRNSQILSAYIRHTITQKRTSAWIAQRNGRTKDGNDKTETGLLKMFNISGGDSFEESFSELNIVPLSISYEFEPCCALKVKETYVVTKGLTYQKAPNEDFMSILTGITSQKGRIHLSICHPVNTFLKETGDTTVFNDKINNIASLMDDEIYRNYRLWPNNYIAFDRLNNGKIYSKFYTATDEADFDQYVSRELSALNLNTSEHLDILLKIYANPVLNGRKGLVPCP
jgi:hypothetical protein